ncbi:MAG: hypothetical protein KAW92_03935 [Candidatus Cloacimonetes bacterium]|nr:hypothetical protein [Candidatus Cloacimonadota bacterium]
MPRGNGTGPQRQGIGRGQGQGKGRGLGGCQVICICPNCRKEIPHTPGIPCNSVNCPNCGTLMTRKN